MAINARVLFDNPQSKIQTLLTDRLTRCRQAWLVSGFVTVEGVAAIQAPLSENPEKLAQLVVGAATWRAFAALDHLLEQGVDQKALLVHLGHTRATGPNAVHRFYRYHPMLHSKVYLMEMTDGTSAAFIGSHNLTGFALLGLNGEAGVLLEGDSQDEQFKAIRQHIANAAAQAVPYKPTMKQAYAWWTNQFIQGMGDKTRDTPNDVENRRTILVLSVSKNGGVPKNGDIVYFELPSALGANVQAINAEVHMYLFSTAPSSPVTALAHVGNAAHSLWCRVEGLEADGGAAELAADWFIDDRFQPDLQRTPKPFRPLPSPGMRQVRVRVYNDVRGKFEYFFESNGQRWIPVLDDANAIVPSEDVGSLLRPLNLIPREDQPWQRVQDLVPEAPEYGVAYQEALKQTSPDSGAYILFSLRRRNN